MNHKTTGKDFLILFIYLGRSVPKYVVKNVRETSRTFPRLPVVLATTSVHKYRLGNAVQMRLPAATIRDGGGTGFRKGFWSKTLDRLHAIEIVHEKFPQARILHLEGDVRLSPLLNFDCFSRTSLNWGAVTENEDGAAILQSPTLNTSRMLSELLRAEQRREQDIGDMKALANIRRLNPEVVELLPSVPPVPGKEIFDFAPLGMWLGGTDPRNFRGLVFFRKRQQAHLFDPAGLQLQVSDGNLVATQRNHQSNVTPSAWRVQNLHLHSKRAWLFTKDWDVVVRQLVENRKSTTFNLIGATSWMADRTGEYLRAVCSLTRRLMRKTTNTVRRHRLES